MRLYACELQFNQEKLILETPGVHDAGEIQHFNNYCW